MEMFREIEKKTMSVFMWKHRRYQIDKANPNKQKLPMQLLAYLIVLQTQNNKIDILNISIIIKYKNRYVSQCNRTEEQEKKMNTAPDIEIFDNDY